MRPAGTVRGRLRLCGGLRLLAALLALASATILIAGCGGSSSPGVANIASSSTAGRRSSAPKPGGGAARPLGIVVASPVQRAQAEVAGLLFSRCMRSHGVPNFPDPSSGGGIRFGGGASFDPAAPLFRSAQRTCISILIRRRNAIG
jgi:hypothetical protein